MDLMLDALSELTVQQDAFSLSILKQNKICLDSQGIWAHSVKMACSKPLGLKCVCGFVP